MGRRGWEGDLLQPEVGGRVGLLPGGRLKRTGAVNGPHPVILLRAVAANVAVPDLGCCAMLRLVLRIDLP
jgi:hypothetical protein